MKKIILSVFSLCLCLFALAQDTAAVAGADREAVGLRAEGKIYVVLVVALTILIGLFIYLIGLDRKITRLEKNA